MPGRPQVTRPYASLEHVRLHYRRNQQPLDKTFHKVAEHVLPLYFEKNAQ